MSTTSSDFAGLESPEASPHPELIPGVHVGPWVVVERVDRGTFGVLFRVERAGHSEAGMFALKLALWRDDPRFEREGGLLQSLRHPSIPRYEDRGRWTNRAGRQYPYLVMEWVEGTPLYPWARERVRSSREVLLVLQQLASALATAHASGARHRDVKGGNVLVTEEGRAVLLDWGCGKYLGAENLTDGPLGPGTGAYRTPEALRWGWAHRRDGALYDAGPADDIYALGVTAYRCTTGTYPPPPTEGPGPQRRLVPPSELSTVSSGLERLMLSCLSWERVKRPAAAALSVALLAAAEEEEARVPIVPTPAAAPTASGAPRSRGAWRLPHGATVALGMAGVVLGACTFLFAGSRLCERLAVSQPLRAEMREAPAETPDGGVGEEALARVEDMPRPGVPLYVLGVPMPRQPLPGQRKPPCERGESTINGACWVWVGGEKPPCGPKMFDHDGKCYFASYDAPRESTSRDQR